MIFSIFDVFVSSDTCSTLRMLCHDRHSFLDVLSAGPVFISNSFSTVFYVLYVKMRISFIANILHILCCSNAIILIVALLWLPAECVMLDIYTFFYSIFVFVCNATSCISLYIFLLVLSNLCSFTISITFLYYCIVFYTVFILKCFLVIA